MNIYEVISGLLFVIAIILIFLKKRADLGYIVLGVGFIVNSIGDAGTLQSVDPFLLILGGFIIGCGLTRGKYSKQSH